MSFDLTFEEWFKDLTSHPQFPVPSTSITPEMRELPNYINL